MNFQDIFFPLQTKTKAMAARACSSWADLRGFRNFLLEGDSLQIVTALYDTSTNMSTSIGQLVEDTKSILSAITEELCTHVCRQANMVAHRLARFGLNVGSQCE
ncbi:F-box protein [Pyrus ussuriensis x Pyrus communis]|uniref:F-box protein n=1 Tax=Pyrus ussuriensis x Pyrus communis TaxID=2448454 RepID=A0A5N5FF62_9ROSA|nr:F-box protein [Pyrus ussuriensis x Pyrus communis]